LSGKTSLSVKKTKLPNKEAPTFNNQCFLKAPCPVEVNGIDPSKEVSWAEQPGRATHQAT